MDKNGYIMSEDIPVIKITNNNIEILNKDLIPLYFTRSNNIEEWVKKRAIDVHRTNSRLLKKVLRLTELDDVQLVLSVNAVTLTDNYWIKDEGSNLKWKDVKFKINMFSNLALTGDPNEFSQKPSRTPELTNIGSYEKCWKLQNGKWWLYKKENDLELFSELFIYFLAKKLNFNIARYEYENGFIKSLDFTDGNQVNYESMESLIGENDDYNLSFETLKSIDENMTKDYLKMIYLDTVCFNMDRHTQNYGVLRDKKNGKIISMAPIFDNNIALISRGYRDDLERKKDTLMDFFFEFLINNQNAWDIFKNLDISVVSEKDINKIYEEIPKELREKIELEKVKKFVLNGAIKINEFIKERMI